ncbi:hypothetical protein G7K_4249-t1 [Saitoella complicata NRRL Y-17804]|uniref:Uncharacterized protein n=1 Tax=Saitoella complicata (strain BCRC 22490 / CBS 7301 / JCM 7358 / NBRC 10748 / NRRL Y-17804) TaxID=698492 RepID=A0A0E9NJU2_SAICN|nr:hypothetical protein G7K_4249-t1 [Saitoella complicata NRRL Y-17804]
MNAESAVSERSDHMENGWNGGYLRACATASSIRHVIHSKRSFNKTAVSAPLSRLSTTSTTRHLLYDIKTFVLSFTNNRLLVTTGSFTTFRHFIIDQIQV